MSTVDELLEQALSLPESDRAMLAKALIRSLDPPGEEVSQEECEAAWADEIRARSDAVHNGTAKLIEYDEAMRRIRGERRN